MSGCYQPSHRPRYDHSGYQTMWVWSGPASKCVQFGHRPFYVQFSHLSTYDHSCHRTMSVRSHHQSSCVQFGHQPFCVWSVTGRCLIPLVTMSGLQTSADWSDQHRLDFRFVSPSGPSPSLIVPSRTILLDHRVQLDLDTTFFALHHTMDQGQVSSPNPPRQKAVRCSQAFSLGNRNQNCGRAMRVRPP